MERMEMVERMKKIRGRSGWREYGEIDVKKIKGCNRMNFLVLVSTS